MTPKEIAATLGARLRERRLALALTQVGLAHRSGVALGTLKRFEHTGQVSLENLLKLALALDALDGFDALLRAPAFDSLDEVLGRSGPTRSRGSRS